MKYWQAAATAAATDTVYRDVQRQVLGNIASVHLNIARDEKTPKPAQVEAAKKAADVYTQLIAVPGTRGTYLYGGRQNLQQALLIAGDTAAVAKSYADMLTNPVGVRVPGSAQLGGDGSARQSQRRCGQAVRERAAAEPVQPRRAVQPGGDAT